MPQPTQNAHRRGRISKPPMLHMSQKFEEFVECECLCKFVMILLLILFFLSYLRAVLLQDSIRMGRRSATLWCGVPWCYRTIIHNLVGQPAPGTLRYGVQDSVGAVQRANAEDV